MGTECPLVTLDAQYEAISLAQKTEERVLPFQKQPQHRAVPVYDPINMAQRPSQEQMRVNIGKKIGADNDGSLRIPLSAG